MPKTPDKPTPRPWGYTGDDALAIIGPDGEPVGLVNDHADGHLIIRAVNAHEALVKAASVLLMHHRIQALDGVSDTLQPRLDALRAALAEAKKGDQ